MSRTTPVKRYIMLCLLLLCMLGVSGCTLELPTPESLIAAPETNQELMQQKQMIAEFLTNEERMIVPEENTIGTAYQYINLDDDNEKADIKAFDFKPVLNPAIITIIISGTPIVYKAFYKLIYQRFLSSPFLII